LGKLQNLTFSKFYSIITISVTERLTFCYKLFTTIKGEKFFMNLGQKNIMWGIIILLLVITTIVGTVNTHYLKNEEKIATLTDAEVTSEDTTTEVTTEIEPIIATIEEEKIILITTEVTTTSAPTTTEIVTTTEQVTTITTTEQVTETELAETAFEEETEQATMEAIEQEPIVTETYYTSSQFINMGVIYYNGLSWTWYSQKALPGNGLDIPGRYVDGDNFVCDGDGYIVLASCDYSKGTILSTPFGRNGKVYDYCPTSGVIDVYTNY
jgi:hypothetical protein